MSDAEKQSQLQPLEFRSVPQLEQLEERLTPSSWVPRSWFTTNDVATHFLVVTPEVTYASESSPVTVIALDASNHVVSNYTGTVRLTSSDSSATLPSQYTFTKQDHGVHTFSETFAATGTDTVTATDTSNPTITGTASVTVDAAPVATHFAVEIEHNVYDKEQTQLVVVALDATNRVVRDYTGTVTLTSTDAAATLPSTYTFTSADEGRHVFTLTPGTTGSQTVTVTDENTNSLTGSVTFTVNPTQVATHFQVLVQRNAIAGEPSQVIVVALDASNHVVRNYNGTVEFSSSDSSATLPTAYTFTTADQGTHVFSVTFAASGLQTLTVADENSSSLTGTASVSVHGAPISRDWAYGRNW